MNKSKNIVFNCSLALNCMLIFLLFFENRIILPACLQVAGRMHPMILHFPIVFVTLYVAWGLFFEKRISPPETAISIGEWLLLLAAFSSAVTALMGLFLSKEEGYDAEGLQWHKQTGVLISLITLLGYSFRNALKKSKAFSITLSALYFFILLLTGHQGAGITHGRDFLLAPLLPEKKKKQVLLEDAVVFADMVNPILQNKCMSCHNSKKAKGDLIMETEAFLLKGGKNGKLWDTSDADWGLMMKRVHLPLAAKKHMPPQGKPQLTDEEISILKNWIKEGAGFTIRALDLAAETDLRKTAERMFSTIESDDYDFAAANESKIQLLNTNYRTVYALAKGSPALGAEFFGASQFNISGLKDLLAVKQQLVTLNLNRMPLKDEDLKTISEFAELRKLNLSFTGLTGKTLNELHKLKKLRHLSLSGNKLIAGDVKKLSALPQLSKLFLWNCGLKEEDVKELRQANKNLAAETGFYGDTFTLKLTPPILENEEQVLTKPVELKLKHYISGAVIRFTTDGSGVDSLNSLLYKKGLTVNGNIQLKAKAYKPGWYSSDLLESNFYGARYRPDSVIHLLPPDEQYKDAGNKTLIDLAKGDNNFRSGKWAAFRQNRMECLLIFNTAPEISSVSLSTLIDIGAYIMPPQSVEVWGGNDPKKLKWLGRVSPVQPAMAKPVYQKGYEVKFDPVAVKYIKLIATPVAKLPAWHPGKGDKGWIFADEIFLN